MSAWVGVPAEQPLRPPAPLQVRAIQEAQQALKKRSAKDLAQTVRSASAASLPGCEEQAALRAVLVQATQTQQTLAAAAMLRTLAAQPRIPQYLQKLAVEAAAATEAAAEAAAQAEVEAAAEA